MEVRTGEETVQRGDRFEIPGPSGAVLAEITFVRPSEGLLVIDHTFVDESLGGRGLGRQLVMKVVDLARSEGASLTATCWYAKKVLDALPGK